MNRLLLLLLALLLTLPLPMQAQKMPLSTDSDAALTHFEQGRMAMGNVQFAKARTHFDQAIEADPEFAMAYLYRAFASPADDRGAFLDDARQREAGLSEGERLMLQAAIASDEDDSEREVELLTEAADAYPDDPWIPFQIGWTQYMQENYDAARAAAERSAEADPAFAPVYNMLGYIHLARKDYAAAEEAFKQYVAKAPEEPNPYDSLGELYLNMERYAEAAAQFEKALERDPEFAVSRDNLAWAQIAQVNDRFEEAFNDQDAEAVAELYTSNAMAMPPGGATVEGRDAIREFWDGVIASGMSGVKLSTEEVRSAGDAAFEYGIAHLSSGGDVANEVRYVVLWQRVGDTWKLHRDMWNSPAPPRTAAISN